MSDAKQPDSRPKFMHESLNIEVVANGYIVSQICHNPSVMHAISASHVFESFESMVAWLKENLEEPVDIKKRKESKSALESLKRSGLTGSGGSIGS